MDSSKDNSDTTYWLSQQFNITFGPYEDRLIVRADRGDHGPVNLLLTRRMVIIVLQQLLAKLPELTGLSKTPAQYWQEVLQMSHQQAMHAKKVADQAGSASEAATEKSNVSSPNDAAAKPELYLATELTVQVAEKQVIIAFKGLPMPQAMTMASTGTCVLATPLQLEHVHQLIQLLITKAHQAQWHLPVDLPWLENPAEQPTSLGVVVH